MIERPWAENIEARIRDGLDEWLALAQSDSFAQAAAEVRALRNQMLADSDSLMALDRLGLTVPSGTTFTAWLTFFKKLGEVLLGGIATYRQALRDVTQQEGFPYNVVWPEKPEE